MRYLSYLPTNSYLPSSLPLTSVLTFLLTNLDRQLAEERRLSLPISTFMQAVSR